ncbi:hypothetical protein K6H11_005421 [Candida tropicalis]
MTDSRQLEEEIQVYEGTSGGELQSAQVLRHRKPISLPPTPKPQVMPHFPYSLVLKVETSEPRDVLQSERTCLTFVRFSTALFFTALGIILNFRIDTSRHPHDGNSNNDNHHKKKFFNHSLFSTAVSYILLALSLFILAVSGVNYFITIDRYAKHKIATNSFNNLTIIGITGIIITLMAINITMIIEAYIEDA